MAGKKKEKAAPEQSGAVLLVRMAKEGQPDSDVHPDEVENWKRHGWREVKDGSGH